MVYLGKEQNTMPIKNLTSQMIDRDFPAEVKAVISANPKVPEFDPTMGVTVAAKSIKATPPQYGSLKVILTGVP
jgi:hypothetical protein